MLSVDYLITGQGLAGSVLALSLLQRGRRVMVIDEPQLSSCSTIAAGIYNPFTYKRMVNAWEADTVTPFAHQFYATAEEFTGARFHRRLDTWKILADANERELWEKACRERKSRFISDQILEDPLPGIVHAPYGIGIVSDCGVVDAAAFLTAVRHKLLEHQALRQEVFHYDQLELYPDHVVYAGEIRAAMHIQCGGSYRPDPRWEQIFAMIPVKGQILNLHIPDLHFEQVLSRGVYLLPIGNQRFVCGATYELEQNNETTTSAACDELLEKVNKFIRVPFTVEKQLAGIRPGVRDRRPILGRHPEHPALAIFNGMGSKGAILSPWLASCLIDHLKNGKPLHPEVNITRKAMRASVRERETK